MEWFYIALGVVLTLGTALFVAAEFSLVALDPGAVEERVKAKKPGAERIMRAVKDLSHQLSGSQIGITLTTLLLGYTTQTALGELLQKACLSAGMTLALSTTLAVIIAVLVINSFSMLFGELVPKNLALAEPFGAARVSVPFLLFFTKILHPVVVVLDGSANWILRRFGVEPASALSGARSAAELAALVQHSAQEGTLDDGLAQLLTRSIVMNELTAVDVMTDRGRMHYLEETAVAAEVIALAARTGHSRFPVIGRDIDDVLGVVQLRRAVGVPFERREEVPVTSQSLMSPAPRVPETLRLAPLLLQLRDEGLQMAMVVDEYGGTSGLVSLEDVIEEIVGEVADEHDAGVPTPRVDQAGTWVVPGVMRPDEFTALTGLAVPEDGPYETLAGLVMAGLGRIPQEGDVYQAEEVQLKVEKMTGRRVNRLRVVHVAQLGEETPADRAAGNGGES